MNENFDGNWHTVFTNSMPFINSIHGSETQVALTNLRYII